MNDPTKILETVLVNDPALDLDAMDMHKFKRERDPALIKELPGKKAMRFFLRPIPASVFHSVIRIQPNEGVICNLAFAYAVEKVTNRIDPDTEEQCGLWEPNEKRDLPNNGKIFFASDEQMQSDFTGAAIEEIGTIAYERAFFGLAAVRRRGFPLPLTLDRALTQRISFHAAEKEQLALEKSSSKAADS